MRSGNLLQCCNESLEKRLQPTLHRIGIPREVNADGPCLRRLLKELQPFSKSASHTPTGFEVERIVAMTAEEFRLLEKELGRVLCDSCDVLFGSIQITAVEEEENLSEVFLSDHNMIDLRGRLLANA